MIEGTENFLTQVRQGRKERAAKLHSQVTPDPFDFQSGADTTAEGKLQIHFHMICLYCLQNQMLYYQQVFEGKRHGVHPENGIPDFSLQFSKELSYGYLRFERNGIIPLGR